MTETHKRFRSLEAHTDAKHWKAVVIVQAVNAHTGLSRAAFMTLVGKAWDFANE